MELLSGVEDPLGVPRDEEGVLAVFIAEVVTTGSRRVTLTLTITMNRTLQLVTLAAKQHGQVVVYV